MPEPPRAPLDWVKPAHENLEQTFRGLIQAMLLCVERQLYTSALVLLYSAMDTAGWLAGDEPPPTVRDRFISWAARYMVPLLSPPLCTGQELYAARCGIVHTMTLNSSLTDREGVRKIVYAWLPSRRETLHEMSTIGNMGVEYLAVQGNELIGAFAGGLHRFLDDLLKEPARLAKAMARAEGFVQLLSPADSENLRAWARKLREGRSCSGAEPSTPY
jgi:hypothetical protein